MNHDTSYDDLSIISDFRERYCFGKIGKRSGPPLLSSPTIQSFRDIIYGYYRRFKRDFPWRHTDDPYHILVSEIMLQQTQVRRVCDKFPEFTSSFPTIEALAASSLKDVLTVWRGMGYNRRARYLRDLALQVKERGSGKIPDSPEKLARLPGIGRTTAASICAFAFNLPMVFVETNIRSVFIHFFFPSAGMVHDREIIPLVEATLDRKNPRSWYSALMDYGAMLKVRHPNPSRRSAHHQKQPPFKGSRRQARGLILGTLLVHKGISVKRLAAMIDVPEDVVVSVINELLKEELVRKKGKILYI